MSDQVPEVEGDSVEARLIEGIANGLPPFMAVKYAGISLPLYYQWIEHAQKAMELEEIPEADVRYVRFYKNLSEAVSRRMLHGLAEIQDAGKKDWKAWAWWLSKKYPEYFGDKIAVEHSGNVQIEPTVTKEHYAKMFEALKEAHLPLPEIEEAEIVEEA